MYVKYPYMSIHSNISSDSFEKKQYEGQVSIFPQTRVVVAMPAYNEEKYIGTMVLGASLYAESVIVVDDGSDDNTSLVAKLAGATVIRHEKNLGKGAAVQTIMQEAKNTGFDILVLMDGDAQHKFEEIPLVIKPIMEGYDIVIGTRIKQKTKIPFYRRIGQIVLSCLSRLLSGINISDSECGFRAFSRKALETLRLTENGFAIETEMISDASRNDLKIAEIPISVIYTEDGSTLNAVVHGMGNLIRISFMFLQQKPAMLLTPLGFALALIGAIIGYWSLHASIFSSVALNALPLISLLSVSIGAVIIFIGLILHIKLKLKTRLQYGTAGTD